MKAVLFEQFGQPPQLTTVPDPVPSPAGVVVRVRATGVCRSDWHGWQGHDDGILLPHVPGHELAGEIAAVGTEVKGWRVGDRVTVPFVCACGDCEYCLRGDHQVCPLQTQPGFTHWGSFAEYVRIDRADVNLVPLPEELEFATAASLGCRFATAFRALIDQGRLQPGQWVAIHGCGGVGMSALMIAVAWQARVIAVDIDSEKLALASQLGAEVVLNASQTENVARTIHEQTGGGAHLSMDALGSTATCVQSLESLRKRGKHLQVGLMLAEHARPALPFPRLIGDELEILGCHGMPAHRYPALMELISQRRIAPERLIGQRITLAEAPAALMNMNQFGGLGMTMITTF